MNIDRERFEDLKEIYALGALDDREREDFESYLAENPELQGEIDDLSGVASMLALSPMDLEPPPSLKRDLMNTVNTEARAAGTTPAVGSVTALPERRILSRPVLLAAASFLVVGLLSWNVILQGQVRDVRGDNLALQGEVESLESSGGQQNQPSGTDRVLAMDSSGTMSEVSAEVVSYENGQAVLVASNLPEIEDGQTFQIWVLDNGQASPSGLFDPQSSTPVATYVGNSISGADAIAVTVEPEGGSEQPTSTPELLTEL